MYEIEVVCGIERDKDRLHGSPQQPHLVSNLDLIGME
jgi:hypothetical protein